MNQYQWREFLFTVRRKFFKYLNSFHNGIELRNEHHGYAGYRLTISSVPVPVLGWPECKLCRLFPDFSLWELKPGSALNNGMTLSQYPLWLHFASVICLQRQHEEGENKSWTGREFGSLSPPNKHVTATSMCPLPVLDSDHKSLPLEWEKRMRVGSWAFPLG